MSFKTEALKSVTQRVALRGGFVASETLSGTKTLTKKDGQLLAFDPNGADRTVTLPDVEPQVHEEGYWLVIAHTGGANDLDVEDADANSVATVDNGEAALVYVTSAGAWALFGIFTFAAS